MFTPSMPDPMLTGGILPPEITFLGNGNNTFDIGSARTDRIVVVAVQGEADSASVAPIPTINGTPAEIIDRRSAADRMGLFYAVVPTGTTVTIAGGINAGRTSTWLITNVNQLALSEVGSGATPELTLTPESWPSLPAAVIGIARTRSNMSSGEMGGSGVVNSVVTDNTANSGSGSSGIIYGHALTDGAGVGSVTFTSAANFSAGLCAIGVFTL